MSKRGRKPRPLADRFWDKVVVGMECWGWSGALHTWRYGKLASGGWYGKTVLAHRVSWELHYGPIPEGMFVCHHCDNPQCANPAHLFLGTAEDNTRDAQRKGRRVSSESAIAVQAREYRARRKARLLGGQTDGR